MGWQIHWDRHQNLYQLYDAQGRHIFQGSEQACRKERMQRLIRAGAWTPTRLTLPTLGGRQWWSDHYLHCGWRIQRSCHKPVYRLLDPSGLLRAYGDYSRCRLAAEYYCLRQGLAWEQDTLVLIVHGLLRSGHSCAGLLRYLRQHGHQAHTWEYASARLNLHTAASAIQHTLAQLQGIRRVHLVTHSLGGLVVRHCLAQHQQTMVASVASIFPPSRGSQLAERLHAWRPYQWLTGPVGQELRPQHVAHLPPPTLPTMVIAGDRGWGIGRLLGTGDPGDGTVAVEETHLPECEHHIVPIGHSFGMNHPKVCSLINDWLQRQQDHAEAG